MSTGLPAVAPAPADKPAKPLAVNIGLASAHGTDVVMFVNPWNGKVMDWHTVPNYNPRNHKPGKWCLDTNEPLDEVALANLDMSMHATDSGSREYYESRKIVVDKIKAAIAGA